MIADDFGLALQGTPSASSIRKVLAELNVTRKKCIVVAIEGFPPPYILQRRQE
jgi:hypothetical protein